MKFLRQVGTILLMALWLLAALPGNLSDLIGSALNLPASAITSVADDAENGVPAEQLLRRVQIHRVENMAPEPPVVVSVPAASAAEISWSAVPVPPWQFIQMAAPLPRAPSFRA